MRDSLPDYQRFMIPRFAKREVRMYSYLFLHPHLRLRLGFLPIIDDSVPV